MGLGLAALSLPGAALAQSASASAAPAGIPGTVPAGVPSGILMTTTDPSIGTGAGKAITFPVDVLNNTGKIELIHLGVSGAPDGWQPVYEDGSNNVSVLQLLPGKDDTITFQVTPPADAPKDQQHISLTGTTDDGLSANLDLSVRITGQTSGGLALTTNYPKLRGTAGTKFEFALTIANNTGKDATFGLSAPAPSSDWQVFFQQTASQTQISSLAVKSGATQDVNLEVTSPQGAKPQDYPIDVVVTDNSGNSTRTQLTVTVIGNYKLDMTTSSQQFSAGASAGQPTRVTLLLANTGNAPLQDVALSAGNAPNGWNVSFQPSSVDTIDPGATSQVQVAITPGSKTAAGDYSLTLSASNGQANVDKEFRVTVAGANYWGWVGVGAAVVLVGAVVYLFRSQSLAQAPR
jgi:uncharacterized membrane protein